MVEREREWRISSNNMYTCHSLRLVKAQFSTADLHCDCTWHDIEVDAIASLAGRWVGLSPMPDILEQACLAGLQVDGLRFGVVPHLQ